ncbi:MAG TPA: DUF58 domain-containing protein [Opitutaceae bacterium]|nr:DUF58 domain-containing protein [Opitutaceae bacterium]
MSAASDDWEGPGRSSGGRWGFRWSDLVWALVFPRTGQRIMPTVSGVILVALAFGIGTAAYNTANNILFITLSLLLACLLLSGVLSWLNSKGMAWRLQPPPSLRAGQEAVVALELHNAKRLLPTYGLWFGATARPVDPVPPGTGEKSKDRPVREILAETEKERIRTRLFLRGRLDAGGTARLEWNLKPTRRGTLRLALENVGSLFPFGFLQKRIGGGLRREVVVWPAAIEYRRWGALSSRPQTAGARVARAGSGIDLFALRRYEPGDSHRLIHWKASARSRQLLVRQFAAESQESLALWLQTPADRWSRPEQFELLVSFAATLAEDLFRAGRLTTVAVNDRPPLPVRRVRDFESFLDALAVVQPLPAAAPSPDEATRAGAGGKNLIIFAPDGARGVAAFVDGEKTASA